MNRVTTSDASGRLNSSGEVSCRMVKKVRIKTNQIRYFAKLVYFLTLETNFHESSPNLQ